MMAVRKLELARIERFLARLGDNGSKLRMMREVELADVLKARRALGMGVQIGVALGAGPRVGVVVEEELGRLAVPAHDEVVIGLERVEAALLEPQPIPSGEYRYLKRSTSNSG